jgi:ankyrin repeat protein
MIPSDIGGPMRATGHDQLFEQEPVDSSILAMLYAGDPWLDSNEGKPWLDALIQRKPDKVFTTAMDGRPRNWRAIAEECIARQLAPETVGGMLGLKVNIGSTIDDGIAKCRFLLGHVKEFDIETLLKGLVTQNNEQGLRMLAAADSKLLLNERFTLEEEDGLGSILHFAFMELRPAICLLLLELIPELATQKTSTGDTILHWAVICRLTSLIPTLLKIAPSLELIPNDSGHTILHLAYMQMDTKCIYSILQHVKDVRALMEKGDKRGWTVLHYLAFRPAPDEITAIATELLLKHLLPHPQLLPMCGHKGETALHLASERGNLQVAEFLLRHAPYLARKEIHSAETPLDLAIEQGDVEMVTMLAPAMKKSLDQTGRTILLKALQLSAEYCHFDDECADARAKIVRLLFDVVTNPSTCGSQKKWQVLEHAASAGGNGRLIDFLLEFDPELAQCKNRHGATALHLAAESGTPDAVKHLLHSKAGKELLHVQMKGGARPIDLALNNGHVFIVMALLSADRSLSNHFGNLAAIFDAPADRRAWRDLAVAIADNDYAQFLATGATEKSFEKFTRKLNELDDRGIGQRLAMFAIWSDEAGEDDNNRQGFENGLAACKRLDELFSGGWLTRTERWEGIQQETECAIRQLNPDGKPPASRPGRDILARLVSLQASGVMSRMIDAVEANVLEPIIETGVIVDTGIIDAGVIEHFDSTPSPLSEKSSGYALNPHVMPYYPVRRPLRWSGIDVIKEFRRYSLSLEDYGRYLFESPREQFRQSMSGDVDQGK